MEIENMLAHGKLDLPISLCFATLRGDDFLLHRLLRKGDDPNKSDKSGRTTLHIAATKGSENCVVLLLDYGADSNSRVRVMLVFAPATCIMVGIALSGDIDVFTSSVKFQLSGLLGDSDDGDNTYGDVVQNGVFKAD